MTDLQLVRGENETLTQRLQALVDHARNLQGSCKDMNGELGKATNAIGQLRSTLETVKDQGSSKLREVKAQAKQERAVLVNTALSSMRQLRSHLTTALSGLRESPAPPTLEAKETMVWSPYLKRWSVQTEGREELVLRLQMPPIKLEGVAVKSPYSPPYSPPHTTRNGFCNGSTMRPPSALQPSMSPMLQRRYSPRGSPNSLPGSPQHQQSMSVPPQRRRSADDMPQSSMSTMPHEERRHSLADSAVQSLSGSPTLIRPPRRVDVANLTIAPRPVLSPHLKRPVSSPHLCNCRLGSP